MSCHRDANFHVPPGPKLNPKIRKKIPSLPRQVFQNFLLPSVHSFTFKRLLLSCLSGFALSDSTYPFSSHLHLLNSLQCWKPLLRPQRFWPSVSFSLVSIPSKSARSPSLSQKLLCFCFLFLVFHFGLRVMF